jgi:hypothetical protein
LHGPTHHATAGGNHVLGKKPTRVLRVLAGDAGDEVYYVASLLTGGVDGLATFIHEVLQAGTALGRWIIVPGLQPIECRRAREIRRIVS